MSSKGIIFGRESSSVAICTLWTEVGRIQAGIPDDKYRLIGNLYSFNGISKLVRTLYAHPEVRTIVLCGLDLGRAGEALIELFSKGVDEQNRIIGSKVILEREIPRDAITLLTKSVSIIDARSKTKPEQILPLLEGVAHQGPFGEPRAFPEPKPLAPEQFPGDESGFIIHETKVALAWPKMLGNVMRFGVRKKSAYQDVKEVQNLVVVIEDESPDAPYLPPYLGITAKDLEEYFPQILTNTVFEGTSYTYGQRLRHVETETKKEIKEVIDQIDELAKELEAAPHSRRAIATTWRIEQDLHSQNPPCLILVQCIISDGRLGMTAFLRSNDVFAAWPKNAFALRKLQQQLATRLKVSMGTLTTIAASAHVYEPDWKAATEIAQKHIALRWRQDKRGYFVIKVEEGLIRMLHYDNNGPLLQTFEATNAEDLYKQLVLKETMSYPEHLCYIGAELAKAEIALQNGLKYVQEEPLRLK